MNIFLVAKSLEEDPVLLFLSLGIVACQLFTLGTFFLWLASVLKLRSSFIEKITVFLLSSFRELAIPLGFLLSFGSMVGSLYMSFIKNIQPCNLCIIQRILLYPHTILFLILWKKPAWKKLRNGIIALLCLDLPISVYHYMLEWYPTIETSVCTLETPCSEVPFRMFGYITVPSMAITLVLTLLSLLWIAYSNPLKQNYSEEDKVSLKIENQDEMNKDEIR